MHFKYYLNNFSRCIPLGSAFPRPRFVPECQDVGERVCPACSGTVKEEKKGSTQELVTKTIWLLGVWQYCQNVMLSVLCVWIVLYTHLLCVNCTTFIRSRGLAHSLSDY